MNEKVVLGTTPIAMCTLDQVCEYLKKNILGGYDDDGRTNSVSVSSQLEEGLQPYYVNGDPNYLRGVESLMVLFDISRNTAYNWKKSFLSPAIEQIGHLITIDRRKAIALYKAECDKSRPRRR